MFCKVIAIANQKGGCGKTTTAINVSACLGKLGKRVLAIDMDPQANLTSGLGINSEELNESIYNVLIEPKKGIKRIIHSTRFKGIDVAPSHINLAGAEIEMVPLYGREFVLKKALENIKDDYDFILIDCPPSLSLLTVNALTSASELIIPVQAHHFALGGLTKLMDMFDIVKEEMNEGISLLGVVVTMFDSRANVSKDALDILKKDKQVSGKLFKSIIRMNIKLVESGKEGAPIIYYDKDCHGATAYMSLTREVIQRYRVAA